MKATTSKGMRVNFIYNGKVEKQKWFSSLAALKAYMDWQYPHFEEMGYQMEILYDEN